MPKNGDTVLKNFGNKCKGEGENAASCSELKWCMLSCGHFKSVILQHFQSLFRAQP